MGTNETSMAGAEGRELPRLGSYFYLTMPIKKNHILFLKAAFLWQHLILQSKAFWRAVCRHILFPGKCTASAMGGGAGAASPS